MKREVYGNNGDPVVVMDVRDLYHGEYTVETLTRDGGYTIRYSSSNLEKCINRAKALEATLVSPSKFRLR